MIKSWYDGPFGLNKPNTEHFFCSKLLAEMFMSLGLFERTKYKPANEYTQKDFMFVQPNFGRKRSLGYHYSDKVTIIKRVENLRNIGSQISETGGTNYHERRRSPYDGLSVDLLQDILKYLPNENFKT